jgi:hypothetical protein
MKTHLLLTDTLALSKPDKHRTFIQSQHHQCMLHFQLQPYFVSTCPLPFNPNLMHSASVNARKVASFTSQHTWKTGLKPRFCEQAKPVNRSSMSLASMDSRSQMKTGGKEGFNTESLRKEGDRHLSISIHKQAIRRCRLDSDRVGVGIIGMAATHDNCRAILCCVEAPFGQLNGGGIQSQVIEIYLTTPPGLSQCFQLFWGKRHRV